MSTTLGTSYGFFTKHMPPRPGDLCNNRFKFKSVILGGAFTEQKKDKWFWIKIAYTCIRWPIHSYLSGYNTGNGYMPAISKPRTEWGKNKTYYKAITDWASLPTELKKTYAEKNF